METGKEIPDKSRGASFPVSHAPARVLEKAVLKCLPDCCTACILRVSGGADEYVITEPERFHISQGKTSQRPDEVVLTETAALDSGVSIGDKVTIRGDAGIGEFTVSGIYHCANDMRANIGMNREGYLTIGQDNPQIWCHHYFLADTSQKAAITEGLTQTYGGDIHVHENSWPGLIGIISAMQALLAFMYGMIVVFVFIVTIMAGSKILTSRGGILLSPPTASYFFTEMQKSPENIPG